MTTVGWVVITILTLAVGVLVMVNARICGKDFERWEEREGLEECERKQ